MNRRKLSTLATAAILIGFTASAQTSNTKPSTTNADKSQDIIIHQKGANSEKMTIVVDGDKVTINGKPADEFENKDITVLRRSGPSAIANSRARALGIGPNMRMFDNGDGAPSFISNKAMLGVVTGKADNGAKINDVTNESAADKAGLQKNDVITKVGSKKIDNPEDLIDAIGEYKPNDKVDITYLRDGKENKTTATLSENKARAYSFNFSPDMNLNLPQLPSLNNFGYGMPRRPKIGLQIQDLEEGKGVTVKDVDDDSPASKAGLKEGDVIIQYNGKDIAGVDDLRNEIKDLREGDTSKFTYKRGGKVQNAELKIPKRLRTADL